MATLASYKQCSTSGVRPLDLQLIAQLNIIAPNSLVSFHRLEGVFCGAGVHPWLQPCAMKTLERAILQYPRLNLIVNSAYRTTAQQFLVWLWFSKQICGIPMAAEPGLSNHQSGLALDIENHRSWQLRLEAQHWDWLGSKDPPHFDYTGKGSKNLKTLSIVSFQSLHNYNHPENRLQEDGVWGKQTEKALLLAPQQGFNRTPATRLQIAQLEEVYRIPIASLQQGSKGAEVRRLQRILGLKEDGLFGQKTEDAVKRWQLQYGLVADGAVGVTTKETLGLA